MLSPTLNRLERLRGEWKKIIEENGLEPDEAGAILAGHPAEGVAGVLGDVNVGALAQVPFQKDTSKPNGSSIAFIAKHEDRSVLFTGDAFANDLEESIGKLIASAGFNRLKLEAWKLSHHGGKKIRAPI